MEFPGKGRRRRGADRSRMAHLIFTLLSSLRPLTASIPFEKGVTNIILRLNTMHSVHWQPQAQLDFTTLQAFLTFVLLSLQFLVPVIMLLDKYACSYRITLTDARYSVSFLDCAISHPPSFIPAFICWTYALIDFTRLVTMLKFDTLYPPISTCTTY